MDVKSTTVSSSATQLVRQQTNNQQQAQQAAERAREQQQQAEQRQQVNRVDVDENAIAVLEQQNQQRRQTANQTSEQQAGYDQPSNQNITAISAYRSVDAIEQRESVQQLLGVDLFA
ncbi:hypothetical protein [Colwellia sp. MEBiC06753]